MNVPVPSPCIGRCELDSASGLCLGCARSADEIARWRDAGDDERRRILAALLARRAQAGLPPQK